MSVELSEATQEIWVEQFVGLSRESFAAAVQRTITEWDKSNMMPPPRFVLDRSHGNVQMQAEAAWETVQRLVFKVWHPDIGWPGGTRPDIDPAIEYAIRQVGGLRKIHDVELDAVQFVRRDFLEAYERYTTEGGAQVALSEKQAAGILGDIQKALSEQTRQKSLPPAARESKGFVQIAEQPKPVPVERQIRQQTPEEYEQRMAELRRQATQLNQSEGATQ